jgi:hypothetical protein
LLDVLKKEVDMANCELIAGCIFFNDKMSDYPAAADFLKNKYCQEDYSKCARYVVCKAFGRERVPRDLFPNDIDRANNLISSGS